jgi:hypothetical protein
MGTKNNQGPFNCHAAALPDEPIFTLLARDPAAPEAIRHWVASREAFGKHVTDEDFTKLQEARTTADEMKAWRDANCNPTGDGIPSWRIPRNQVDEDSDRRVAVELAMGVPHGFNLQHANPTEIDTAIAQRLSSKTAVHESLTIPDEVPGHRFAHFHKGKRYAYAKGLEVSPIHLPAALDAMAESGWDLLAIFGETDSKNVGFIFEYRHVTLNNLKYHIVSSDPNFDSDDYTRRFYSGPMGETFVSADPRMDACESGRPLDEIRTDAAPSSSSDIGRGVEP